MTDKLIVLVTCANKTEAMRIAGAAVKAHLAACVNVLSMPVDSVYRWKGKVERAKEVLLLMKTSQKKLPQLRDTVTRLHSYAVPEFIAVPVAAGSRAYLRWLDECLAEPRQARRKTGASKRRVHHGES